MRKLRRIICCFSIVCGFISCYDDYVEGRVITKLVDRAQVRTTEAICEGEVVFSSGKDVDTEVIETGFLYSKDKQELTNDIPGTYNTTTFSCHLTGLSSDTKYYVEAYAVVTYRYTKDVQYETTIFGAVEEFTTKQSEEDIKFTTPQNLSAEQINNDIVLGWNMPQQDELIWFVVERSNDENGVYAELEKVYLYTTFTDNNPLDGVNYYRVKAVKGYPLEESDYAYVFCNFIPSDEEKIVPDAPTGVSAVVVNQGIKVQWHKVNSVTDYRIYRCSASDGDYGKPIGRVGDVNYWVDYEPIIGDNYYRITAFNLYESEYSDYAHCKYP